MIHAVSISSRVRTAILAGLFILPFTATSQGIFNEARISVDGVGIYVDGEVTNEGELSNNGLIALTGDWKSKGKYSGGGVLEVIGSTPQKISHYEQSVGQLVINGWGTKYIKGAMHVDSSLALKNGIVEVSPEDLLNLRENVIVSGGSPDSYVDGALTAEGTGYRFFPIGKNGTYAPIEFIDVHGEDPQYSLEAFEHAPVISVEDAIVRNALYWQRKDLRGTFSSSPVAIDYDRNYFENSEDIILVVGSDWEEDFSTIKNIEHSSETDKVTTRVSVTSPIILLGEISEKWTEADFYFSTALSPHASHTENHKVKIFGGRLSPEGFHFQVFDRWGGQVFESLSLELMSTHGWDGRTLGGAQLATGTYPYRLSALDKAGKRFERKGVITIIH